MAGAKPMETTSLLSQRVLSSVYSLAAERVWVLARFQYASFQRVSQNAFLERDSQ